MIKMFIICLLTLIYYLSSLAKRFTLAFSSSVKYLLRYTPLKRPLLSKSLKVLLIITLIKLIIKLVLSSQTVLVTELYIYLEMGSLAL